MVTNSIGMQFKLLQVGTFAWVSGHVTLTQPFYIGVYPVTQAEYER